MVCCAAPAYLARHGAPRTPADLAAPRLPYVRVFVGAATCGASRMPPERQHDVKVTGPAHANNGAMLAALAVEGVGVTLEPDFIVAADVRAGRLVRALARAMCRRRSASTQRIRAGATCLRRSGRSSTFSCCASSAIHRGGCRKTSRRRHRAAGRHRGGVATQRGNQVDQGIWILPPPPSPPPGPSVAPAGGSTIDDDACRRISWISRIARSMPAFVASA